MSALDWRTVRHRLASCEDDDLCALCRGCHDDPIHRGYTLEEAVSSAVLRAARDRAGSFSVLMVRPEEQAVADIVVQDAHAAHPRGAVLHCITQLWLARADGTIEVQIRRNGAHSEWREVTL